MHPAIASLWGAGVQLAALLFAGTIALAQVEPAATEPPGTEPAATESREYYARVAQAVDAYDQGHWPEAYALFQQAHELSPNARTLRGLALTAFKLRRYVESERRIEAALVSNVKPLTDAQRVELSELREWARRYIDRIELEIRPPGARALIDGVETASRSLSLDVGEHVLTVHAKGHVSQQRRLIVEGRRQLRISVSLVPLALDTQRVSTRPAAAGSSGSIFASPWLWTAVGVVAGGGLVFALTREEEVQQQAPYMHGAALLMGPAR